jgi:hypothetical protein
MYTDIEFEKFLNAVSHNQVDRLIGEEIAPHTCQLLHKDRSGNFRPYASGVWRALIWLASN